jgi:uncharacterized protein
MPTNRSHIIDALRGVALFGILAVNIQSAAWSVGGPSLGEFDTASTVADYVAVVFTAFFLEFKFYPVFCFCFGYGFAVQACGWKRRGEDATKRFARRMGFMLILGVLHGVLLWFGDILARYGLAGFVLARYINEGPRALLRRVKFWLLVSLATAILSTATTYFAIPHEPNALANAVAESRAELDGAIAVYESGTFSEVTIQRANDFASITLTFLFVFPQVVLLFLLGTVTAQMRWLTNPEQSRAWLKKVFIVSFMVGLPINVVFTVGRIAGWYDMAASYTIRDQLVSSFVPTFAFAFIAGTGLIARYPIGQKLIAIAAPAGKIALTNYIFQSIVMSTLLYGYGFGWAKEMRQADLLLLALAVYVMQLMASHLYLRYFKQGPLEWVWRRWTNG